NARPQPARSGGEKNEEQRIRHGKEKRHASSVQEKVNEQAEHEEIHDHGGGDVTVAQAHASEAFAAAMVFRHALQQDAPPKIAVDLQVPLLPSGVDGVAPVLRLEQRDALP